MRWLWLVLWAPSLGHAYSLQSGLTESCHEVITGEAFLLPSLKAARAGALRPDPGVPVPDGRVWRQIGEQLFEDPVLREASRDDPAFELVFLSLVVGVRAPDTEGHAVTNLNSLRRIHADASAAGQYAHALRGPDDDGGSGDQAAIAGTEAVIRGLVDQATRALNDPVDQQIIKVDFYFDFYGLVSLEVWAPAYYLGRAAHAVQDSYSHTIRSEDLSRIRHVLNFVDAISGDLKSERDGLAHSDAMDRCVGDTELIVAAAILASAELLMAAAEQSEGRFVPLDTFFVDHFQYEAGCTQKNGFCGSRWLAIAQSDATGPYLGCATTDGSQSWWWVLLLWPMRRRAALGALVLLMVSEARADEWPIQVEGHVSALSDAPNRSVLASTFGWAVRGGWRRESLGLFGHIERNYWVATNLKSEVFAGTLDIAFGVEYLFADGFLRSSIALGASILMDDTPLHDAGQRGGFGDLRPIDFRWGVAPGLFLNLTPLGVAVVSPVLEEPAIRMIQYRTTAAVEYVF